MTPRYVTQLISKGTLKYFEKSDFERVERRVHVALGTLSTVEREDWHIKHIYNPSDLDTQTQLLQCILKEYKDRESLNKRKSVY